MKTFIVIILLAVAAYLGYRLVSKPKPAEATVVEKQPAGEATSAPPIMVQEKDKAPAATNLTRAAGTNKPMARVKTPDDKPKGE
ncbi:MAG TPA: hypothetical protein VK850_15550, partial [Candidatus Binatia bacterium]|nr:hypothetical protein [Candidatus Binatia bacterium]